jgi:hypothetical protein
MKREERELLSHVFFVDVRLRSPRLGVGKCFFIQLVRIDLASALSSSDFTLAGEVKSIVKRCSLFLSLSRSLSAYFPFSTHELRRFGEISYDITVAVSGWMNCG